MEAKKEGIDTITFEHDGKSTTVTPEQLNRAAKAILGCNKMVTRELPVHLTTPEIQERSQAMAGAVLAIEALDGELDEIKADFKARRKAQEKIVKDHATTLKRGWEERLVECGIERAFTTNLLRVYRLDTGELVEERAMTPEERQRELAIAPAAEETGEGAGLQ